MLCFFAMSYMLLEYKTQRTFEFNRQTALGYNFLFTCRIRRHKLIYSRAFSFLILNSMSCIAKLTIFSVVYNKFFGNTLILNSHLFFILLNSFQEYWIQFLQRHRQSCHVITSNGSPLQVELMVWSMMRIIFFLNLKQNT